MPVSGGGVIRVLHVDDDRSFADVTAEFLERVDDRISVTTANSAEAGLDALADGDVDCVVSDYDMPGRNGIEFLEAVREDYPDLPFVLFTGKGSEEVASEAISAGVTEYIQKERDTSQYAVLANRIANVVEQYRSERELEDSRERLSLFFEQSPLGVIEWTESFEVSRVNAAAEGILGYSEGELRGESWERIVPESDRDDVDEVVTRLLEDQGGYHSVNENVTAEGERIVCEWHNRVVTDDGEVQAVFSQFQDVTGRQRRERELEELKERYRAFVESGPDVLTVLEDDGTVAYQSPAIERVLGYDPEELVGKRVFDYVHPGDRDRVVERYTEMTELDGPGTGAVEYRFRHADGSWVWLESMANARSVKSVDGHVVVSRDVTERAEYRQQLETMIDNLPGYVYRHRDEAGWPLEFVKGAPEDVLGYTATELEEEVGIAEEVIHPEDRDDVRCGVKDGFEADSTYDLTYRIVTRDGERRWVRDRGIRVEDPVSGEMALDGFVTDVTERKEREAELEEKTNLLHQLFERVPIHMYLKDEEGRFQYVSEFYVEGDTPTVEDNIDGFLGKTDREVFGERGDVGEGSYADDLTVVETGEPVINREEYIPEFDAWNLTSKVPWYDTDGEIAGLLGVSRRITERKRYERAITDLHRVATDLSDRSTREGIYEETIEAAGSLLEFDQAAIATEEDGLLVVRAMSEDVPLEDRPTMSVEEGIAGRSYRTGESFLVDDASATEWARPQAEEIRAVLSVPIGDRGVFQVVSDHPGAFDERDLELARLLVRHTEDALDLFDRERELEARNERLEGFASVLSHDLRNPLTVAEGNLNLAREDCDSEYLDEVSWAHDRMRTLIEELLTLAREGEDVTDRDHVELADLVEGCWENVETADATLVVDVDRTVLADGSRLKQVFENLYRNALEHGGEGVTVTVGELEDGFYVEDDGPGIPESDRDEVFELGYSTSEAGTGFGLSIVEQAIEAHGWEIRVTEGSKGGARFEITGVGDPERSH